MPHSGDYGCLAGSHGAGYFLLVERPQILQASTPSADHEQVQGFHLLSFIDHGGNFPGCLGALHPGGKYDHPTSPVPSLQDA